MVDEHDESAELTPAHHEHRLVKLTPWIAVAGVVATVITALVGLPGPVDGLAPGFHGAVLRDADITLKLAAGVGAGFVALAAAGRFQLSRDEASRDHRKHADDEKRDRFKHANDRFSNAAELLGASDASTKLSGVYSLEHLGLDSATHRPTLMRVLGAFIREQCRYPDDVDPDETEDLTTGPAYAALDVVSRNASWGPIDLRRVVLRAANLEQVQLAGADLTRADLRGSQLSGAELRRAVFVNADLRFLVAYDAHFEEADLAGAKLEKATLARVNLDSANLSWADLRGANLLYAHCASARFWNADLRDVDASFANVANANLRGANLKGAALAGAIMTGSTLAGADLEGANLRGADLSGVDLSGANVTGADLLDASLEGATLDGVAGWPG